MMRWIRVLLFVILVNGIADISKHTCFDEVSPLQYKNTLKEVPKEERVSLRIHSGGWDTQTVVTVLVAILLREKMGVDVEFYPPLESLEEMAWDEYWDYHKEDDYWVDYFHWVRDEHCDLVLQFSQVHVSDHADEFRSTGRMDRAYFTGFIEEAGWYIPQYTVANLNFFPDYRSFLDKSALWTSTNGTVLASLSGYSTSSHSQRLIQYHKLPWKMNFTEDDFLMYNIIKEKVANQEAFVFQGFNPTEVNFDIMEQVNWPTNPSALESDPCVAIGQCGFVPLQYYASLASDFSTRHPEFGVTVTNFLNNMVISRTDINRIYDSYQQNRNIFDSACEFLNSTDVWESWVSMPDLYDYQEKEFSTWSQTFFSIFGTLTIILFLAAMLILNFYDDRRFDRISITLTCVWCVGFIVFLLDMIVATLEINETNCIIQTYFYNIGLSTIIIIPLLQAYRITMIFQPILETNTRITDGWILWRFFMFLLVEIFISVGKTWQIISGGTVESIDESSYSVHHICDDGSYLFTHFEFLSKILWCSMLLYYGLQTKSAWEEYRESHWNMYIAFLLLTIISINYVLLLFKIYPLTLKYLLVISGFLSVWAIVPIYVWRLKNSEEEDFFGDVSGPRRANDLQTVKTLIRNMENMDLIEVQEHLDTVASLRQTSRTSNISEALENVARKQTVKKAEMLKLVDMVTRSSMSRLEELGSTRTSLIAGEEAHHVEHEDTSRSHESDTLLQAMAVQELLEGEQPGWKRDAAIGETSTNRESQPELQMTRGESSGATKTTKSGTKKRGQAYE